MLDIKLLRDNPDIVKKAARDKRVDVDVDAVLLMDGQRRTQAAALEEVHRERNAAAKAKDIERGKEIKKRVAALEAKIREIDGMLEPLLFKLPNIPTDDTPVGPDESANVVLRQVGELPKMPFAPKDHVALGKKLGIINAEKGAEVAGARFVYLKGDLVMLQYALVSYAFSVLMNRAALRRIIDGRGLDLPDTPFIPVTPPLMIRPEVFQKMARLEPKEERYYIPSDDLFLIGSAEHTLGPIHLGETLREEQMPLRYAAFTTVFRREAGSYGKDTHGILRLHQFDKLEMESFSLPEKSREEHELFVAIQEHLMQALGLPYQVVQSCTGDLGDPNARKIDIECWMPAQNKYRETHSADYMTDFQARRLGTRIKRKEGGSDFAHTNDATCFAIGRTLIGIMENFQREDGTIAVPEPLVPFMGGKTAIGEDAL